MPKTMSSGASGKAAALAAAAELKAIDSKRQGPSGAAVAGAGGGGGELSRPALPERMLSDDGSGTMSNALIAAKERTARRLEAMRPFANRLRNRTITVAFEGWREATQYVAGLRRRFAAKIVHALLAQTFAAWVDMWDAANAADREAREKVHAALNWMRMRAVVEAVERGQLAATPAATVESAPREASLAEARVARAGDAGRV